VCDGLGIADLGDLAYFARLDRFEECQGAVTAACAALPRDVAVQRLTAAGAPVAPVLTPEEMGAHPHFRERGVIAVDDDGELRVCVPAVFGSRPARRPGPSPEPDADHDAWNDSSDESRR
jgi:crotonobetainyl-CoA:carnitine CoA-transferase CaiB-like acyl-CoA transferase